MTHYCGDCQSFQISRHLPGDPPVCYCGSPETKKRNPPIGPLRGPDAPSCEFFLPAEGRAGPNSGFPILASSLSPRSTVITIEERFLNHEDVFCTVAETAHLLQKSESTVYRHVSEGHLQVVHNGSINVYKPSILAYLNRKK